MKIHGLSFHSVKGGVGKSTLATIAAVQYARENLSHPVYLIDMDLTGTSLADVLPLSAPSWANDPVLTSSLLARSPPTGFDSSATSRLRVEARNNEFNEHRRDKPSNLWVPFLNDFLLHEPPEGDVPDGERDVNPEALCWRLTEELPNLHVIPSSAIPGDLDRIVPVIFAEQHAAFLEARLETLLARLLERHPNADLTVVVDVPPTIPGLSRSVMSLALRLARPKKLPLAAKASVPTQLSNAEIAWGVNLVTSPDPQDLLATQRWLALVLPEEREHFRVVVNRHPWPSARDEQITGLRRILGIAADQEGADPLNSSLGSFEEYLSTMLFVKQAQEMEFFRAREIPRTTLEFGPA